MALASVLESNFRETVTMYRSTRLQLCDSFLQVTIHLPSDITSHTFRSKTSHLALSLTTEAEAFPYLITDNWHMATKCQWHNSLLSYILGITFILQNNNISIQPFQQRMVIQEQQKLPTSLELNFAAQLHYSNSVLPNTSQLNFSYLCWAFYPAFFNYLILILKLN